MISKNDILSMARKATHRSQGHTERKIINPHREWFIGVSLFIIVSTVGGVLNARNYVYYNTLELTITDTTAPIKKYQDHIAKDALKKYSERTAVFNLLANEVPVVVEVSTSTASSSEDATNQEEETTDGSGEYTETGSTTNEAALPDDVAVSLE